MATAACACPPPPGTPHTLPPTMPPSTRLPAPTIHTRRLPRPLPPPRLPPPSTTPPHAPSAAGVHAASSALRARFEQAASSASVHAPSTARPRRNSTLVRACPAHARASRARTLEPHRERARQQHRPGDSSKSEPLTAPPVPRLRITQVYARNASGIKTNLTLHQAYIPSQGSTSSELPPNIQVETCFRLLFASRTGWLRQHPF